MSQGLTLIKMLMIFQWTDGVKGKQPGWTSTWRRVGHIPPKCVVLHVNNQGITNNYILHRGKKNDWMSRGCSWGGLKTNAKIGNAYHNISLTSTSSKVSLWVTMGTEKSVLRGPRGPKAANTHTLTRYFEIGYIRGVFWVVCPQHLQSFTVQPNKLMEKWRGWKR